jgi:hypothetical protein
MRSAGLDTGASRPYSTSDGRIAGRVASASERIETLAYSTCSRYRISDNNSTTARPTTEMIVSITDQVFSV